jgi:hypothetical protein
MHYLHLNEEEDYKVFTSVSDDSKEHKSNTLTTRTYICADDGIPGRVARLSTPCFRVVARGVLACGFVAAADQFLAVDV